MSSDQGILVLKFRKKICGRISVLKLKRVLKINRGGGTFIALIYSVDKIQTESLIRICIQSKWKFIYASF